jgi:hypothetical protein
MIEFQYFEGCPNSTKSLANLRELMREDFFADQNLKITEVPDLETSQTVMFQGSPTILFEGKDLDSGKAPKKSSYTCRIYKIEGEKTGVLTIDFIRERILKLSNLNT